MKLRDLTADFVKTLEPYASPGDSTDATKIWLNAKSAARGGYSALRGVCGREVFSGFSDSRGR